MPNTNSRDNLENVELEIVDGRELALLIRVTMDGDCRVSAKIPKEQAAAYLRQIADQWDAPMSGARA